MNLKFLIILPIAFCLISCAHGPDRGDKMLIQSNEAKILANQWKEGNQLIQEGKSLQVKGNELINKGQKKISEGKDLITDGNNNISNGNQMLNNGQEKISQGIGLKQKSETSFSYQYPNSPL